MDNEILKSDSYELEMVAEYKKEGKLEKDFLDIETFDMVQSGYPIPNKGVMVPRLHGGTNEKGELLSGNGMWCKVSDVKNLLDR